MATYAVRLYQNTGFNGVNIPDTPAQLNKCTYIDLDPVHILQDRGLDHVDVSATWAQVENADYCKVGDWYYSIPSGGAQMVSENTCRLSLLSDPLTSAGGFSVATDGAVTTNFNILDGITQRCTVRSDEWGEYTNDDPLIVPQEPLQIQTEWLNPSGGTTKDGIDGDPICIESTIDLSSQAFNLTGDTYTDDETGETVTVPQTSPIKTSDADHTTSFSIDGSTKSDGTEIFIRNDTSTAGGASSPAGVVVDKGLSVVRQLGIESGSIIAQWRLPKEFCGGVTAEYPFATGSDGADTAQRISLISSASGSLSSSISPDYASVKNKRLLYGEYNKYGIVTCAGNSAEFKPEDLGGETAPSISYKSDPRASGKPYYRFTTINGDTDFWRNCVAGSQWENVPLVYQGASGSALTRLNFDNDRAIKSLDKTQYEDRTALSQVQAVGQVAGGAASVAGTLAVPGYGAFTQYALGSLSSGASQMLSGINNIMTSEQSKQQYEDMYRAQKANELSSLYQSTTVYAPTVNFPYNADILRDIKGNGVLLYKYRMSDGDIARCDKLLTMYGYQTAEALTPAHFGRRQYFDYVACSTVSITGLPKWWCDEIATQLKVGVRVWHTLPNTSYYTNNPVRS